MRPTTTPRVLQRGMVLLRIYIGLDFLTNGLAKRFDFSSVRIGTFLDAGLIDSGSAQHQLLHASQTTFIAPLGELAAWIANDAYSVFGPLLTIAELALGVGMLTGALVRWAAIGRLVPMVPVRVMIGPTHDCLGLPGRPRAAADLRGRPSRAARGCGCSAASDRAASRSRPPSRRSRPRSGRRGTAPIPWWGSAPLCTGSD